ncbi:MAG: SET domain-containing protein-lysine N-methyltransferase [Chthoniobacterales bacterium]|nr:SET domain-containing protein-lysine N-methyltransferase [Chthoniobacterales bacterium]
MATRKKSKRASLGERVQVRPSGVHGKGVFALRPIRKGARIIEYTGERVSWKKAQELPPHDPKQPHHTFFFSLDDGNVINAAVGGNDSRWINHSCNPNCETSESKDRIYVTALRSLKSGEELFYDYRLEPAERRTKKLERLFRCNCGNDNCRGTMLDLA